ncbi:hypothetical protein GWI33_012588 [Rhynchophorus ferrugineus]|uniref:Peptidase C1A papain C-terminal domain-containing protein n=1 Tax=Rhynchophorus ferrugineus TaxID=354439 RepID=A0A834MCB6_RHYFE|nr:hypothetical protein GWI33_012588 [Rhynchophorus ferrugineus]
MYVKCDKFSSFQVGALEPLYARKYNKLISLSEQSLIDIDNRHFIICGLDTDGCNSGIVQGALEYVQNHGIATEDRYKYLGYKQNACHKFEVLFKISGYKNIAYKDEKDLKNAVGSIGPVSVSLNGDLLQRYAWGIINGNCSDKINHAAVVVGYGRENGQEYWILKNSWAVNWGENGYFRLGMGNNLCSVATQACYPYL